MAEYPKYLGAEATNIIRWRPASGEESSPVMSMDRDIWQMQGERNFVLQQKWKLRWLIEVGPYGHYDVYDTRETYEYEWRDVPVAETEAVPE